MTFFPVTAAATHRKPFTRGADGRDRQDPASRTCAQPAREPERAAAESPFGGPIGHGFLTLGVIGREGSDKPVCVLESLTRLYG